MTVKLPDNVNAQLAACINAVLPDIVATPDPSSALLPLALEILAREFGSFVLFCRLGDRMPELGGIRAQPYGVVGEGIVQPDPKLVKIVADWAKEHGG